MPGRGHGCRRRGGRPRRGAGLLEPTLLLLLHQGTAHGYVLTEDLQRLGLEVMDTSIVYRSLRDMEAQGWLTSTWDEEETQGPPRRIYRLTPEGNEVLSSWIRSLEGTRAMIENLLGIYHRHMREEARNTTAAIAGPDERIERLSSTAMEPR
jgi:PadR family transcriptional regulator PadR